MSEGELPPQTVEQAGGMTTGEWGTKVYGEMGQQSAIPGTNVIQTHGGSDGETPPAMPPTEGGMPALLSTEVMTPIILTIASNQIPKLLRKSLKLKKTKGGAPGATSLAVPAVLILANHMLGKRVGRKTNKSRGRKHRRTRRR
jgi:hypothetical protein